jgi:hypothetical protein
MGHVACTGGIRNAYRTLVRKPQGERSRDTPKRNMGGKYEHGSQGTSMFRCGQGDIPELTSANMVINYRGI